jgi:hypothetical protein
MRADFARLPGLLGITTVGEAPGAIPPAAGGHDDAAAAPPPPAPAEPGQLGLF